MANKLAHPDLHFSFPVIKRDGDSSAPISDHFLPDWRNFLAENSHPVFAHWLDFLRADNKQATFYVEEAKSVLTALALKPHQGGKKVLILWMPEKMPDAFANKLLKPLKNQRVMPYCCSSRTTKSPYCPPSPAGANVCLFRPFRA